MQGSLRFALQERCGSLLQPCLAAQGLAMTQLQAVNDRTLTGMRAAAGFNNGSFTEDHDAFGLSDWCATLAGNLRVDASSWRPTQC